MSLPFIIADETLQARLESADGPVPICAPDGRVLAYATPTKPARLQLQPRISEEEIQLRIKAGGGRKLSEIMADLEKRV